MLQELSSCRFSMAQRLRSNYNKKKIQSIKEDILFQSSTKVNIASLSLVVLSQVGQNFHGAKPSILVLIYHPLHKFFTLLVTNLLHFVSEPCCSILLLHLIQQRIDFTKKINYDKNFLIFLLKLLQSLQAIENLQEYNSKSEDIRFNAVYLIKFNDLLSSLIKLGRVVSSGATACPRSHLAFENHGLPEISQHIVSTKRLENVQWLDV